MITTSIFLVVGIFLAVILPKEYQSHVTDLKSVARITLASYIDQYPAQTLSGIITKYTIGLPETILNASRGNPNQDKASGKYIVKRLVLTYFFRLLLHRVCVIRW